MSYIQVITLQRAKNYLRVDETLTEDDAEITSMINAACRYIEKRTNHILYARDIIYDGSCQVKVYDFPINSIITDPIPIGLKRSLYTIYPDVISIELNVGYTVDTVPDDLIEAMLQIISVWYYDSEKQVKMSLIPESVKAVVDLYRRFL